MNIKIKRKNGSETIINLKEVTSVLMNNNSIIELKSGQNTIGVINRDTEVSYFDGTERQVGFDYLKKFLMENIGV